MEARAGFTDGSKILTLAVRASADAETPTHALQVPTTTARPHSEAPEEGRLPSYRSAGKPEDTSKSGIDRFFYNKCGRGWVQGHEPERGRDRSFFEKRTGNRRRPSSAVPSRNHLRGSAFIPRAEAGAPHINSSSKQTATLPHWPELINEYAWLTVSSANRCVIRSAGCRFQRTSRSTNSSISQMEVTQDP